MASESFSNQLCNPFASDIFPDGVETGNTFLTLHQDAQEKLNQELAQAVHQNPTSVRQSQGRVILLRAPRAGYGKSHLLSGLLQADNAFVIPVEFDPEAKIAWKPLFDQVLACLHQTSPGASLSQLDDIARHTFASVNAGMILSGKVPCAVPEEAAATVRSRYRDLFDFAKKDQPVAQWFQDHFERLLPVGSPILSQETGLSETAATLWLRALCGYSQAGAEKDPSRLGTLQWALKQPTTPVHSSGAPAHGFQFLQAPTEGDTFFKEKLGELCRLAAADRPVVILLDHLDGFHGSSEKILRLANFLNDWRQLSGRVLFVLSVNQDLWTETFLKALPSALEDRLTGGQITLGGLSRETAEDLIKQRLDTWRVPAAAAEQFLSELSLGQYFAQEAGRLVSPRAVLRYAAHAWQDLWSHPAKPRPSDPSVPVARMRDMLERIKERLVLPTAPPDNPAPTGAKSPGYTNGTTHSPAPDSGAILRDPHPAPPRPPLGDSPFLTPKRVAPDHALQVRFHTLRAHFASSPWLLLDQDRLYHLMKLSGQRLALVRFLETGLPGLEGAVAGVWQSPDAEILFGSEPYEDRAYWGALIDFARQRSTYVPGSRLVLFSAAAAPVNLAVWLHQDEIVAARAQFLDLQTLDHSSLAALYATDEVLRESERGALPLGSADAFASLAPQLEGLWKKLTRPLASA
ncbi:MAG: hypothetical protein JWL81_938 [Verrucomicrobiales bacterium]|nr:hypothetical protein [Verrucomicrobiales bacterium]